jgi:hypothetical protein
MRRIGIGFVLPCELTGAFRSRLKDFPMRTLSFIAAGAATIALAAPAAAQYSPYPQPTYPGYPQQTYPGYPQQTYPGYGQPGYGAQNPVGAIIDQLLGNRYNVTDRQAVSRCASAAVAQASAQYRPNNGYGYNGQGYGGGYGQGYSGYGNARVTAITDVQRRSGGLRVTGMLDSRGGYGTYAQPGYGNRGFAAGGGDLTFRCNVDYRGAVTNIRIRRNNNRY